MNHAPRGYALVWMLLAGLASIVVCIALNAFFVAAEFALVTIRHTRVEELAQTGDSAALALKRATARLDDAIAATQLGITLASIAIGWLGEPALAQLLERPLARVLPVWHDAAAHSIATVVAFGSITFLHVVLGELAPKAVALGAAEPVALRLAGPLLLFQRMFRPVIHAMNASGNWVVRRFGFEHVGEHAPTHSVREIQMLVTETNEAGDLDPLQAAVVGRALSIRDKRVRDIMVPIDRIAALDETSPPDVILDCVKHAEHSRMPLWSPSEKRFTKVVNTKALLLDFVGRDALDLHAASYTPATLHHAAPLTRALRMFLKRHQHMALVSNDDGDQIGIVTLEDVLEEIVGEIEDELDETVTLGAPQPAY